MTPLAEVAVFVVAHAVAEVIGVRYTAAVADRRHVVAGILSAVSWVSFSLAFFQTLTASSPTVAIAGAAIVRGVTAWGASRWGRPRRHPWSRH